MAELVTPIERINPTFGSREAKQRSESALAPLLEEEDLLLNQLEEGLLVGSGEVALISSNRCW